MITQEQAARFTLMRHGLAERLPGPLAPAQGALAFQAQMPHMPYLQAWARVQGFAPAQMDAALYDHRTLVRTWIVRGTLHIVPSADLPLYLGAVGPRGSAGARRWFARHGPPLSELTHRWDEVKAQVRDLLAAGPRTRAELAEQARGTLVAELMGLPWGGIFTALAYEGVTVHAEPQGRGQAAAAGSEGAWATNPEYRFARLEQWLPDLAPAPPMAAAETALVRRYLAGYGPVSARDVAHWTGWRMPAVRGALDRLAPDLDELEVAGQKGPHYMLSSDRAALLAAGGGGELPLRLLPRFDPLLLGHADKTRFLPAARRTQVFTKAGHVGAVLLLAGRVAGLWSYKKGGKGLEVAVQPWQRLPAARRREVEAEAASLAALFNLPLLRVTFA